MVVECYFVGMFSNCGWDVVQLMCRGGIGRVMSRFSKETTIGTEKTWQGPTIVCYRVSLMFSDGRLQHLHTFALTQFSAPLEVARNFDDVRGSGKCEPEIL